MHYTAVLFNIVEACPIRCRHCGYSGSARRGRMEATAMREWIAQALACGIPHVIFTGGEPFADFALLRAGVEAVRADGGTAGVFSNGFWGQSRQAALDRLRELPGLTELYLSSDRFHQEHIPLESIRRIAAAAADLGIPKITVCITVTSEREQEDMRRRCTGLPERVDFHFGRVIRNPEVAAALADDGFETFPLLPGHYPPRCFLHTPLVNPGGTVAVCHVGKRETHGGIAESPFYLGDLAREPLCAVLHRADGDPLYQFLRVHGPRGVVQAATAVPWTAEWHGRSFASACEMCAVLLADARFVEYLRRHCRDEGWRQEVYLRRCLELGEEPDKEYGHG